MSNMPLGKNNIKTIRQRVSGFKNNINNRMDKKHMDFYIVFLAAAFCVLLTCLMLFVKPVAGVADDGTVLSVITGSGLAYPNDIIQSKDYFVKEYVIKSFGTLGYRSVQTIIIGIAKAIDYFITGSMRFDIRFLGLVYIILYIPAIMLFIKAAIKRLKNFSQKVFMAVCAVIMFCDAGYITYFNSFYPEALIFISLLYMSAAAVNLCKAGRYGYLWIVLFATFGIVLCFVRRYCFFIGFAGALFCFLLINNKKEEKYAITAFICGFSLIISSFCSLFILKDDFNRADKLHSMTRGVLLQSINPENTLSDFGIDMSYSLLTDVSAFDLFPATNGYDAVLEKEFLNRYDIWDIYRYYIKHPLNMAAMLDIAVKANIEVSREDCGNFEEADSINPGERTLFWSAYSMFKNRSMPKTIGFFVILIIVNIALNIGKSSKDKKGGVYLSFIGMLTLFTIFTSCFVIVKSGDAALIQYNGQLGMVMDIILFFTIGETLERLNIL